MPPTYRLFLIRFHWQVRVEFNRFLRDHSAVYSASPMILLHEELLTAFARDALTSVQVFFADTGHSRERFTAHQIVIEPCTFT